MNKQAADFHAFTRNLNNNWHVKQLFTQTVFFKLYFQEFWFAWRISMTNTRGISVIRSRDFTRFEIELLLSLIEHSRCLPIDNLSFQRSLKRDVPKREYLRELSASSRNTLPLFVVFRAQVDVLVRHCSYLHLNPHNYGRPCIPAHYTKILPRHSGISTRESPPRCSKESSWNTRLCKIGIRGGVPCVVELKLRVLLTRGTPMTIITCNYSRIFLSCTKRWKMSWTGDVVVRRILKRHNTLTISFLTFSLYVASTLPMRRAFHGAIFYIPCFCYQDFHSRAESWRRKRSFEFFSTSTTSVRFDKFVVFVLLLAVLAQNRTIRGDQSGQFLRNLDPAENCHVLSYSHLRILFLLS